MIKTILDYVKLNAIRRPKKVIFEDLDKSISCEKLYDASRKIASNIVRMGKQNKPVMVYMNKSVECIEAFIGVICAGGFYSPVDVGMPMERLTMIHDTLSPELVICDKHTIKTAKDKFGLKCICVEINQLLEGKIDASSLELIERNICKTDIMYVLFTSGSTGKPKGVAISHRAALDFAEWICEKYEFGENDNLCSQAPFYFDASVPDIVIPIVSGATTYIPPKTYYTFPKKIVAFIDEKKINTLIWVPSALKNIIDCKAFDTCLPSTIEKVLFCGEIFPVKYLKKWKCFLPNVKYVNMYGPTEATYACTYYDIPRDYDCEMELPLGYACDNCRIILLDDDNFEVADDEIGELCIIGDCLANGYYNDLDITDKVFIDNPINISWHETLYRTGDLAKKNGEGVLFFVGRKDSQIKKLGYRIELGEIEKVSNSIDGVDSVCCFFENEENKIYLAYVGMSSEEDLRNGLLQKIPQYMIPDVIRKIRKMPLNMNGKIDWVLLKNSKLEGL